MWARDILIVDGICYPGEKIRDYGCRTPSTPIPATSNAILVQLQGKERLGRLQVITLMRSYRVMLKGKIALLNIQHPCNQFKRAEVEALRVFLKERYCKAYLRVESQAVLASSTLIVY